jgi:hypothetical protein
MHNTSPVACFNFAHWNVCRDLQPFQGLATLKEEHQLGGGLGGLWKTENEMEIASHRT